MSMDTNILTGLGGIVNEMNYGVNSSLDATKSTTITPAMAAGTFEKILNSVGLTNDRMLWNSLNFTKINLNHTMNPIDFVNYGRGYMFMTPPDLNLFEDNRDTINTQIRENAPDLYDAIQRNVMVAKSLQSSCRTGAASSGGTGFMNLLSNLCVTCNVPSIQNTSIDGPLNSKKQSISMPGDIWESIGETEISLEYYDTRDRHVTTAFRIWLLYMSALRSGKITMKKTYIMRRMLDFAVGIYIPIVNESGNIMTISGMLGATPRNFPTALNQYKLGPYETSDFVGPFTVDFKVAHMYPPDDIQIVNNFNYITGYDKVVNVNSFFNYHDNMYKNTPSGGYTLHSGAIVESGMVKSYPYNWTITDKFADMIGIDLVSTPTGVVHRQLNFLSRNFGTPVVFNQMT